MSGKLLALITRTIMLASQMLHDKSFNETQRSYLQSIEDEARAMLNLFIKLPDVSIEKLQKSLDFGCRSHLTTIIGYCDLLLDEDDGELTNIQKGGLQDLHTRSYDILAYLMETAS